MINKVAPHAKKRKVKECASYLWKSISQLRSVTCRMGLHSVTFHPTQANTSRLFSSPTGWYSIYRPFKDGGLSKPRPRVQRATWTGPRLLRDSPRPARPEHTI